MKKILSYLLILVFAFVLVGCNTNEKTEITVNFDSNGGSEVTSMTIKESDIGSFALPQNPTREGFTFKGWFLDADCANPFNGLTDASESITLYAKWEEVKLNAKADLSLDFNIKYKENKEATSDEEAINTDYAFKGALRIGALFEETEVTSVNDIKGTITISLLLQDTGTTKVLPEMIAPLFSETTPLSIKLYINNGFAYAQVGEVTYKIDLSVLLAYAEEKSTELLDTIKDEYLAEGSELPTDLDGLMPFLMEQLSYYAEKYNADLSLLSDAFAILMMLLPEQKTVDGNVEYSITQEDFEEDVDNIVAYITLNGKAICGKIYDIISAFFENLFSPKYDEFETEDGKKFIKATHSYIDAEGNTHDFSEDLEEQEYGYFDEEVSVYESTILNCYYLVDGENWTVITAQEYDDLYIGKNVTDAKGNTYTYGTPSYTKPDGTVVSVLTDFEQLEKDGIGSYSKETNTFKVYATYDEFDVATGKIFDERAYSIDESYNKLLESVNAIAEPLKEAVQINELKLVLGENSANLGIDVKFDGTGLEEVMETLIKAEVTCQLNASVSESTEKIVIPELTQTIDMTDALIGMINSIGSEEAAQTENTQTE